MNNMKKKIIITAICFVGVVAVLCAGFGIYVGDYYHADLGAVEAFSPSEKISRKVIDDGIIVFEVKDPKAGLIFYPGGKVEYTAYIPLMQECASKGILCVLVEMPFNLAVLDINAADGLKEKYPEIENWYMAGHSLGGSMAASYLGENEAEFSGLILLGSYSTVDFSSSAIEVLSIFGSNDKVLNREKYEENKVNLPADFTEEVIDGGCHAYFGMYGEQKGDGKATITNNEQIEKTAEKIEEFIKNKTEV